MGDQKETETLIDEEALLFASYLRNTELETKNHRIISGISESLSLKGSMSLPEHYTES